MDLHRYLGWNLKGCHFQKYRDGLRPWTLFEKYNFLTLTNLPSFPHESHSDHVRLHRTGTDSITAHHPLSGAAGCVRRLSTGTMSRSLSLSPSPPRVPISPQQLCPRPIHPVLFRYPTYSSRVSLESRYGMCLLLPSHLQQSGQLGVPIRDVLALAVHQGGDLTYSSRVSLESRYGMCLLLPSTREEISPAAAGSAWSPDTGCACSCRPPERRSHLQQPGQLGVPIRDVLALAVHQGGDDVSQRRQRQVDLGSLLQPVSSRTWGDGFG